MKISGVYKITNTVTGDFYIGSSKNIERRWKAHKEPSRWSNNPNILLYRDFQKYGVDKFEFQILANVEPDQLKEAEQQFIEKLQPTYNNHRAKGLNTERINRSSKNYYSKLCSYNGETLTLRALALRFGRSGIKHPTLEAKKYLLDI